jgi:predicted amidohydrolase YtcJ
MHRIFSASTIFICLVALTACKVQTEPAAMAEDSNPPEGGYAELIIRDTPVFTLNEEQPWAQAVAVRNGRIVMVGSSQQADRWTGPDSVVISQPGGLVLPGFQDAHVHPLTSGVDHFDCDLNVQLQTQQAYLDKITECAASMPDREWISGGGWLVTAFPPNGIPDKALLDGIVPDRPMVFFSADGHTAWTNSKAMELAGITRDTADPPNGRIDRDPASGEPVGSFQESAMELIRAHLPPPPQSQIDAGMRYTIGYLHSLGITAMQEAAASIDPQDPLQALPTYRRFADSGALQMHTVVSLLWDNDRGLEQIPDLIKAREQYDGGLLNAATVKIFLDGVIEPSTAALLQDYTDQPGYRGELQVPQEILNEAVARLDKDGFQVHMHVIGDAAVRAGLDAVRFALERNGPTNGRHHLAHVELVDPADIPRFAELNVTANFSPLWAVEDKYLTELTLPHVGPQRYQWIYPINSIIEAGGRVAFGSDWNVSSPDPLLAIETAVTRVDPLTGATLVFLPRERITLEQAITAATRNAAYVNHLDDRTGSVEVGKLGDLVVLDHNLFEIEPAAISDARVVATIFDGQVVYHQEQP